MPLLLPLLALSLAAAPANPWLESAKDAYSRLECDRVLADLELAKQVPTNDLSAQLAIYDYSGRCHVALGQRSDAEAAFAKMLELDSRAELDPALSPKIRDAFRATKLRLYPADYVAWRELSASEGLKRAELVDPWTKVDGVVVGRWNAEAQRFDEEPLTAAGSVYLARVAAKEAWFFEARAASGSSLALIGRKEAPLVAAALPAPGLADAPAQEPSKARRAAGWVAVGTGAVATVAGVVFMVLAGNTRADAEKAEWGDSAGAFDRLSASQRGWGAGLLVGGVAVGGAGVALSW